MHILGRMDLTRSIGIYIITGSSKEFDHAYNKKEVVIFLFSIIRLIILKEMKFNAWNKITEHCQF